MLFNDFYTLHSQFSDLFLNFAPLKHRKSMNTRLPFFLSLLWLCLAVSCGREEAKAPVQTTPHWVAENDSTLYGLACDGTNDTILVFLELPYTGTDPDTLNVLQATRNGQVYGWARFGDQLAIIRNDSDATVADRVIVIESLLGHWRYMVRPSLRHTAADSGGYNNLQGYSFPADSIRKLLKVEREYGYDFKDENRVRPVGFVRRSMVSDDESPVVYPELKRYHEWHIVNGRLILSSSVTDTLGNVTVLLCDTADLVYLAPDSLVLQLGDTIRSFYRKEE